MRILFTLHVEKNKKTAKDTNTTKGYYPPPNHMLRDLSLVLAFQASDKATIRAPAGPSVSTDGGTMLLGVMATLVDVLGGGLALRSFYPDWAATTHLSVQSTGRALCGYVDAQGELKKTGRNTVLVMVDIRHTPHKESRATPVATAIIGYTRFRPKDRSQLLQIGPVANNVLHFISDTSGLGQPFLQKVGLQILNEAEGLVQVEMNDYVRNSFNALQGGVFALLADLAGQTAARCMTGKPFTTADLAIQFLRQGKVGPFQTRTSILRKTKKTVLSRVEILDRGEGDRLLSIATNLATPV